MAGRTRGSIGRKVLWGVVGYVVTTLGTLLTSYLTTLHISPLLGSVLATTVGLVLVIVGVLIDEAKDGGGDDTPQRAVGQARPPYPGHPYGYPPVLQPDRPTGGGRRSAASLLAVLLVVILLCGGGGFGVAYGAQWLGHKAIDAFNQAATPPWERKTQDPGHERLAGTASHSEGPLTVSVSSVRVNSQATIVTITAKNTGTDSLNLPVYSNAQLDVPGVSTFDADPAAGTFKGTVPAHGEATGTIVFDGVIGAGVTRVTLSFANVMGSLDGPGSIAVEIPISAG
jgi:hypothetical protein